MLDSIYDDLELFISLVNYNNNVSKLIRELNIARTTFNRRISKLEKQLKLHLLKRDGLNIDLTEDGKHVYNIFAHKIAELRLQLQQINYSDKNRKLISTIRLALPNAFMHHVLSAYIAKFTCRHPDIILNIRYLNLGAQDFVNEEFDIAISNTIPQLQGVKIRKLGLDHLKLYGNHEYIKQYGIPKSLNDLHFHNCVGYLYKDKPLKELKALNLITQQESTISIKTKLYFDNSSFTYQLAKSGKYITCFSNLIGSHLVKKGEMVEILPQYSFFTYERYLIMHSGTRSKAENELIKFLLKIWEHEKPLEL